ncbi:glycerol-3-phosphate dehydrogenase subunit GlpB [Desulforegula conservatrix]|uniref:glycerol-3-phosphate dehydrogenase subunit GlpB n=1 Tax=Desulforegula conservatrix TaxID=153026 RepID=UPI000403085C|nr:glycerol-3-phosphate dehydrogenase subunit GlpB [Desulforegula conservatrix]
MTKIAANIQICGKSINKDSILEADVLVAGKGLAGLSAAFFAAGKGLRTVVSGGTSGCRYMSGLLDFMDICSEVTADPVPGFSILPDDHPFKRINPGYVRNSIHSIMAFLSENGLKYENCDNKNCLVMTSAGSIRTAYGYPISMKAGIDSIKNGWPVLIVEFEGMKGFSASQVAQGISGYCGVRTLKIRFPGTAQNTAFCPESAARSLDLPGNRMILAQSILPYLKDIKAVGFPAVLGIYQADKVISEMSGLLGVPVFEIPGYPPSVPGLRFEETMTKGLERLGVKFFRQNLISEISYENGFFGSVIDHNSLKTKIRSKGLVLSTGRFLSKGLVAGRTRIYEPLLGLPVIQPCDRDSWHFRSYFNPEGHPLNRSGVETDECMRPVGIDGRPVIDNLYAAGSILAGQDWKIEKCGAALSFASAAKAVDSFKIDMDGKSLASAEVKYLDKTGEDHGNIIFSKAV